MAWLRGAAPAPAPALAAGAGGALPVAGVSGGRAGVDAPFCGLTWRLPGGSGAEPSPGIAVRTGHGEEQAAAAPGFGGDAPARGCRGPGRRALRGGAGARPRRVGAAGGARARRGAGRGCRAGGRARPAPCAAGGGCERSGPARPAPDSSGGGSAGVSHCLEMEWAGVRVAE